MQRRTIALLALGAACSLRDLSSLDSQYDAEASDASVDVASDVAFDVVPSSCADDAGLVARWPMTEGTGTTVHDCTGAHDGTLSDAGVGWLVDPEAGAVLGFDAGFVRPNVDLAIDPPFTVSAWVRANDPQPAIVGVIFAQTDALSLRLAWELTIFGAHHQLDVGLVAGETDFTSQQNLSVPWSHVAATFDGVNVVLYTNGQPSLTNMIDAGYVGDAGANMRLRIGQVFQGNRSYAGAMRDVRIYSRVLSASEVAAIAQ
jgi:hypothetical protein